MRFRPLAIAAAASLLATGLSGCASVNEKVGAAMGDYIPQWAGGLPADAPPRQGTAKYDEWMRERERNRLLPASEREGAKDAQADAKPDAKADARADARPDQSKLDPVH